KIPVERAILGESDLPGTVLRLPMVYGPGDPLHRFFPLLKRIDDGRPAILFSESMARWRGSKGYSENVAAAIALAAMDARAAGRVYNVAEPETESEGEWAARAWRRRRDGAGASWSSPTTRRPPTSCWPATLNSIG